MRIALVLLALAMASASCQSVEHPLRIGGDVKPPTLIHQGDVVSPEMWVGKVHSAYVSLTFVVDEQGVPRNVAVRKSNLSEQWWPTLQRNVETQYRFRPATFHGTPVAVRLAQKINLDGF